MKNTSSRPESSPLASEPTSSSPDTEKEFGTKGRVPIQATFDGVPYTGSLVKYSQPQHMLCLLKSIRKQIGKQPGLQPV
jgi:uncharacterized protein DUF1905